MDLKNEIKYWSGLAGDFLEDKVEPVFSSINNTYQQGVKQLNTKLGLPEYIPVIDDIGKAVTDPSSRPKQVALPSELVDEGVGQVLQKGFQFAEEKLGLDPRLSRLGLPLIGAITVNNPHVLKTTGRKLGQDIVNNDPQLAKHLVERRATVQRLNNEIDRAEEIKLLNKLSDNPDLAAVKKADRSLKRNRPKLYSTESNVKPFDDVDYQLYGANNQRTRNDQERWKFERKAKGKQISEKIHKHHLVTKGGTAAAFRKMEEFIADGKADLDDLVVMYEYAEKKYAAAGDRKSNNAYILDTPHNELHQQVLKPAGDEFKQEQWKQILNELKTPEDLMKWWVVQVNENYVPNKQTGLIWQDLDDLIKDIQSGA